MGEKGLSGAQAAAALLILDYYTRHFTVFPALLFFDFFFFSSSCWNLDHIYENFSPGFTSFFFPSPKLDLSVQEKMIWEAL